VGKDQETLQAWYRQAMLGRMAELRDLRESVCGGDASGFDAVRKIGQALRGSGATFGFPDLTAAAAVVETARDEDVLRHLEGLLVVLDELSRDEARGGTCRHEWLAVAVGLDPAELAWSDASLAAAWAEVERSAGLMPSEVCDRVAAYLDVDVADPGVRVGAARRLVPGALVTTRRVVPLDEDPATITLATANPTDLEAELEVRRLTGRVPIFAVASPSVVDALITEFHQPVAPPQGGIREGQKARSRGGTSASTSGDEGAGKGGRVIIVDDDESMRLLLRAVLEKRGWGVVEASDGLNALDVMRSQEDLDLVIVDLDMPRMDGLEFLWTLRDHKAWETLPVIVVTGEEDEMLEAQLLEEGADDYVRKPVDGRLLLARVESTLRRTSARA
jgi:CheY-like chemotaxis protein